MKHKEKIKISYQHLASKPTVHSHLVLYSHKAFTSDGPKQSSAEISAEVSAESSAETEISVIRTEISVCRHYKEMSF